MRRTWTIVVAAIMSAAVACGPIVYVNEVTRTADTAVETARSARADKYAPYWWTRAVEYLHKAREVAAHADFQAANRYGRFAAEAAHKATIEAELAARDPSKRPIDLNKQLAPAREPESPRGAEPLAPAKDTP
ncbi:MAG: hypothetical protein AB7P03_12220 [Kofleriaceae bacterium]